MKDQLMRPIKLPAPKNMGNKTVLEALPKSQRVLFAQTVGWPERGK